MPTLNLVIKNQPMVSVILTQLSSRKQFGSRRKRSMKREGGSYLYIHLYYKSVVYIDFIGIKTTRLCIYDLFVLKNT